MNNWVQVLSLILNLCPASWVLSQGFQVRCLQGPAGQTSECNWNLGVLGHLVNRRVPALTLGRVLFSNWSADPQEYGSCQLGFLFCQKRLIEMWPLQPGFWKTVREPNKTPLWSEVAESYQFASSAWDWSQHSSSQDFGHNRHAWVRTSPSEGQGLESENGWTPRGHVQRLPCWGCLRRGPAMRACCGNDGGVRMLGCPSWNHF